MALRDNLTIYKALGRHPVHPFPARMAPEIVCGLMRRAKRPLRVLDPMMGSGTVVALAQAYNHRACGVDIDPLAALMSEVWVSRTDHEKAIKVANEVLVRARRTSIAMRLADAYPVGASKPTRKFVRYWFDNYSRRQLTALALHIELVRDRKIRNVLWCAFSRLIITKDSGASLARDLAHSRPHKSYDVAPAKPLHNFITSVAHVLSNSLVKYGRGNGPAAKIQIGDARRLRLHRGSIDLVLTSPPYLNAIDYIRCSKFSLVWMGHGIEALTKLRSESVGTEVGRRLDDDRQIKRILKSLKLGRLSPRKSAIVAAYIDDMRASIREIARVLAPGGRVFYVIGENTIDGVYVRNAKIIKSLARKEGLKLRSETSRQLPQNRRYLPPPKSKARRDLHGRMRTEVLLHFGKVAVA